MNRKVFTSPNHDALRECMTGKRLIILALAGMFFCAGFTGIINAQETEIVYIGQGDHYDLGPYFTWGDSDLWVNMTVTQGGNVDIYVMSMNQYMNAYPYEEEPGGISFKSSSQENVSQANIYMHIEIDEQDMWADDQIWVIIDNRDVSATPNDATPTGNVQVEVEIGWESDEYYYDDFFWMEGILCVAGSLVPTILIIVLLFLIYRKLGKKKDVPPHMPYPPYPPTAAPPETITPVQPHMPVPQEPPIPPPMGETPVEPRPPDNQE